MLEIKLNIMIVIVFGLPGSGKSYFASRLATRLKAQYLNSDRERKRMFAKRIYSPDEKLIVYEEMLSKMKQAKMEKISLVLDATFHKDHIRKKFIDEAGNSTTIIEVHAKETLIHERLNKKREDSEADFNVYKIIQSQWEPMKEEHLKLESTDYNIDDMLDQAIKYIELKHV